MKLGFKYLDQVADMNHYEVAEKREIVRGNADTLYLRLETIIDNKLRERGHEDTDVHRTVRYLPQAGATLTVNFINLDSSQNVTRVATNPFPQDTSIWMVPILPTDVLQYNSVQAQLFEGVAPNQVITQVLPLSEIVSVDSDFRRFFT